MKTLRLASAAVCLAAGALLALPAAGLAQLDGELDVTFDGPGTAGNGKFLFDMGSAENEARDVLVQPDGKILVVGFADVDATVGVSYELALARFNASGGTLDSTFDGPSGTGNGRFTLDLSPGGGNSIGAALALDSTGRILVGGHSDGVSTNRDFMVARLVSSTGDLDDSFSADGFNTTSFSSGDDSSNALAVDSSDRPILVGSTANDFAVARFTSTGATDSTFSGDGRQTIDIEGGTTQESGNSVLVQPDGKIVVGARTNTGAVGSFDFGFARLDATGVLDPSFDGPSSSTSTFPGNGKFAVRIGAGTAQDVGNAMVMQGGDKILAGGEAGGAASAFGLMRLDVSDGDLDTSFDGDGIVTTDISPSNSDLIQDLQIDSKGRIVAIGQTFTSGADLAVARYSPDGVLDTFFDGDSGTGNGVVVIDFTASTGVHGLAIESDGDLVIAGDSNDDFALARLKVDLIAPNTLTSGPGTLTTDDNPVFSVSSTETASSVQCTIDTAPVACTTGGGQQFGPFADGPHTFTAAAADLSGNLDTTPAVRNFTVDTTAPDGSITGGTGLTNDTTPAVSFSADEVGSAFQCRLDPPGGPAGGFGACGSPATLQLGGNPLPDGEYTFLLRTTDLAGNVDPSDASGTITVDATAPQTSLSGAHPGFSFGSSESPSSFECRVDAAPFASCTSPRSTASTTAPGTHTFAVRAIDEAGNTDATPASAQFTIAAPKKKCKKGRKLKKGKCVKKKRKRKGK